MKVTVPFPEFLPDQSPTAGALIRAEGVYPASTGCRAIGQLLSISDPLDGPFMGGASMMASDGGSYLFAATDDALFRYTAGTWDELVSGVGAPQRWRFAQFGDFAIMVNGDDTRQVDLTSGIESTIADAPTATSIMVVGNHVVVGGADGDIAMVQWSAWGNHQAWTPGVDQSGSQPMLTGGEIMGLAGGEYGLILQRFRLTRMTLTGNPDDPFLFQEITPNVGCASKSSIAQAGDTVFWLSDRGFVTLGGGDAGLGSDAAGGLRFLGNEKVDKSFEKAVGRSNYERIWSAVDPERPIVAWGIPGNPGTIWLYNFAIDRWAIIKTPFQGLFSGFTSSTTLEALSTEYPDLDDLPYSLDDPRFRGGDPCLYVVGQNGEVGTFAGENQAARIDLALGEPAQGRRARVRAVRPVTDAKSGVTVQLDCRARLGDAQCLTTATGPRASGIIPIRCSGRHIGISLQIAAGENWSYADGIEIDFEIGGER